VTVTAQAADHLLGGARRAAQLKPRNIPLPIVNAARTLKKQGHPANPEELPVSRNVYIESTRSIPRGGVVLSSMGRAYGLCASKQDWKPGWQRE
jgi:hypothetical protein